jgi:NAD(P)H-dependent FMN reductase
LDYADLPFLNQDIEFPTPEPVRRVREAVKAADGIWFFCRNTTTFFQAC